MPRILTKNEIEQFRGLGYFKVEGFFYPNEVRGMRRAVERIHDFVVYKSSQTGKFRHNGTKFYVKKMDKGKRRIEHVNWCGAMEPLLMHYSTESKLTRLVSSLLESDEADHLINQLHFKMPGDRMKFRFHQDCANRRYGTSGWKDINGKGSYVAVVAAIDEMAPDNGPLLFSENPGEYIGKISESEQERHRKIAIPMLMSPGDIIFIGPYVIHGSFENNSDRSRRVLINGFAYPGANSRTFNIPGAGKKINLA